MLVFLGIGIGPPLDEDADDPLAETEQSEEQSDMPEIEEVTFEGGGQSDSDDEIVVDPSSLLSVDIEERAGKSDDDKDEIIEIAATEDD